MFRYPSLFALLFVLGFAAPALGQPVAGDVGPQMDLGVPYWSASAASPVVAAQLVPKLQLEQATFRDRPRTRNRLVAPAVIMATGVVLGTVAAVAVPNMYPTSDPAKGFGGLALAFAGPSMAVGGAVWLGIRALQRRRARRRQRALDPARYYPLPPPPTR